MQADPLEDDPSVIAGFADMYAGLKSNMAWQFLTIFRTSMTSASSSVFVKGEDGHTYRRYPEGSKYLCSTQ
jgi:hypothetical protein